MMDPGVPVLDAAALDQRIAKGDPLVVLFYADWCGFCTRFLPAFRERAGAMLVDVIAANLQSHADPRWDDHEVPFVPTLVAFDRGRPVVRADGVAMIGLRPVDLERFLDALAAFRAAGSPDAPATPGAPGNADGS